MHQITPARIELVKIGSGRHFGELALVDDAKRAASI
jgi:hypothetical protein